MLIFYNVVLGLIVKNKTKKKFCTLSHSSKAMKVWRDKIINHINKSKVIQLAVSTINTCLYAPFTVLAKTHGVENVILSGHRSKNKTEKQTCGFICD